MNYYPNCSRPELVLGVSPHSDASSITLLIQDDDITGLQIRHEEGWVPVKPIPNAIVINELICPRVALGFFICRKIIDF